MKAPNADGQNAQDMARLVAGGDAALNELMERHAEKLFHYRFRTLQDASDAADLAQETFVRVYQSRAKFDGRQKFSTWLYTIASNLVRDRLQRLQYQSVFKSGTRPGDGSATSVRHR